MYIKEWSISSEKHVRNKFSIISFWGSLLVMWIHTYNLEAYGIESHSTGIAHLVYCIEKYWTKVATTAVPMFFLVSGFLFFRTFSIEKILKKYKTRIRTILIPYLCWCTIYYFYFVILSSIPFIKNMLSETDIVNLSLQDWLGSLWIESYYTLWFLKNLIIFIIISPCIYLLLNDWGNKVPIGITVILFMCFNIQFGWVDMPKGLEWYLIGSWIAINHNNWVLYRNKIWTFIAVGYIVFILVTGFRFWNIWLQIIFYIAIWSALDVFKEFGEIPGWMQMSFFTYVAHDIFLESFEKVFLLLLGKSPVWALVDYIFMPFVILFVLVIVANILQKISYPLWQLLVGYR